MDGSLDATQQTYNCGPLVQVDHDGRRSVCLGPVGLFAITNERHDLMAVLLQFGEHMRSDESCCARECDSHDLATSCFASLVVATAPSA